MEARAPFATWDNRQVSRTGEVRHLLWTITLHFDAKGEVNTLNSIARDVTDRRQLEEQEQRHQQQLAHVARLNALGELATSIAHEVNQPLTAIAVQCEACSLALKAGDYRQVGEDLRGIDAQVERAGEIVHRVRRFAARRETRHAAVDLNQVVENVIRWVEPLARKSGISIEVQLTPELPPVLADAVQLEQVLLNLVRNAKEAVKLVDQSGWAVTVSTSYCSGGMLEVAVCDAGPGIAGEIADRLFEPFCTTKESGLGLGLSISRTIIEAHGGRLWVTPNPGDGVTFRFTVPVCQGEQSHES